MLLGLLEDIICGICIKNFEERFKAKNYQSVSLYGVPKTFTKLVNRLVDDFEKYRLFFNFQYGISGQVFDFILSFCSNVWCRVVLEGHSSHEFVDKTGINVVNDILLNDFCNISIYGDDATRYFKFDEACDM